ncbi:uncharacterized protein BDW43DRAFT_303436 [Aspergillus alliaceus]|uniref:uncharacterized protein n=1 Tax=Petromyces alliaceus TaxID=209559 RepID=UPI0012A5E483|nr:uncharacterized protein BDW43DRAFT_303436 [Aspergillus alliaceus]KAB8228995.1 hypothetical protein BDW43DRAFT_303436 [Aspergillus alliaceus]
MASPGNSLPLVNTSRLASQIQKPANVSEVEDYRSGYPRLTALLSSHSPYFICRSFTRLRARVLLLKQDRLSVLEQKLDQLDEQESSHLFLGKSRSDKNLDRMALLSEVDSCLTDYDSFLERTHRTLGLGPPSQRDVQALRNWLDGTGAVARDERAYLTHFQDLVTVAPTGDTAVVRLETWVEDQLIRYYSGFRNGPYHDASNDANVYIYSGSLIRRAAKALLLFMITMLLLAPVILCNITHSVSLRVIIIMAFTISYLLILSILAKSRTMELIIAGAT